MRFTKRTFTREAQQLADMKAMFEQELIPSREIYEDKVRQILGLR